MGGVERKKLFLSKTLKIYKASDEFLHILPGEVSLLARGWADPEEEVLFYLLSI